MTTHPDEEQITLSSDSADPDVLAAAAARVLSGSSSEVGDAPTLRDPEDGPVCLPAGFRRVSIDATGAAPVVTEVTTAWIRELNGEDEEKISKAQMRGSLDDFFRAVLESGVEKLGDTAPSNEDLNSLVIGDRDFLLMQIALATYGSKVEYERVPCPHCGEQFDVTLDAGEEVPIKRLSRLEDQFFEVNLRKGKVAKVSLPTARVTKELAESETPAEANTLLIAASVISVTDSKGQETRIQGDKVAARRLSVADRQTLVNEMYDRMPGPDYNGVKFNHEPGCGKEVRLGVTLADLFRSL